MVLFDVVAAFPHAGENDPEIFMWPPLEWLRDNARAVNAEDPDVWHMLGSLYGRQTAGANFRDDVEEIVKGTPGFAKVVRGMIEPALFKLEGAEGATEALLTHHIDDGRVIAGTIEVAARVVDHLGKFYVLKVSNPQWQGDAHSYLKRVKVRLPSGWLTIPRRQAPPEHHEARGLR